MNKAGKTIHIAIAFDQNYVRPFYALLTSILTKNSDNKLQLHLIATGVSDEEKKLIKQYTQSTGNELSFYELNEELVKKLVLINDWTPAVYYRLFFPFLIPENVDRILYLDADTIVCNDLSELYSIDIGSYPLAAVYDNYVKTQPLLNITLEGEYFNSGVMLLDVKIWREQKVSERAIDYVLKYPDRILFVDQCALNAVLHKNWKKINSKYNLLYSYIPMSIGKTELNEFLKDKVIVHFTLQRPWNMLCKNRLRFLYHYYLAQSPIGDTHEKYNDFEWSKVPEWIKIRLSEFYFDYSFIRWLWRNSKFVRR